jgi:hypothetical protein
MTNLIEKAFEKFVAKLAHRGFVEGLHDDVMGVTRNRVNVV